MKIKYTLVIAFACLSIGCDPLDTKEDTMLTPENLESDYNKLQSLGYAAYTSVTSGFYVIDSNIGAAMSDEAANTKTSSSVKLFNEGTWNQYNNPDNVYSKCYEGIRAANFFLDYSINYKEQLVHNRDTLSDNGLAYQRSVKNIEWMRAEAHVLRAYYYFELIKRYGDVPLVKEVIDPKDNVILPRSDFDEIVDYLVSEIDLVVDDLQADWNIEDKARDGRFTKGAAMALKSRILLYAASPLNNPSGDIEKWKAAAQAAYDVIALNQYSLDANYRTMFLEANSINSKEMIMVYRHGAVDYFERANYPVGTPGGNSGVTPSQNLVDAYEYKGTPNPNNPYDNRDPRLGYSIVTNNSSWNGRTMEIFAGGKDDPKNTNASRTGYYLKKFLIDNLNLTQGEKRIHNWVMFRYGEILLNYAEAMNEAYGPDNDNDYGISARQAIDMIRSRTGVEMPPVIASSKNDMQDKIKHERRIELAFEGHRFWDLLRWKDAELYMNAPLRGISITRSGNSFSYQDFIVEKRTFDKSKMYRYPIPYTEVVKSGGILTQNSNW